MTSGTRILLLIIALFVGILILYYGFLMPPVAPRGPETAETAAPAGDDPAPTRSSAVAGGAAEPAAAAQTEQATETATDDDGAGVIPPPSAVAKTVKGASPGPRAGIEGRNEGGTEGAAGAVSPAGHGVFARVPVHLPAAAVDPPPAAADRSAAGPPRYMRYVVKDGDTMSSIAMWWFGEAGKWDLIAKANLVDPNRLSKHLAHADLFGPPRHSQRRQPEQAQARNHDSQQRGEADDLAQPLFLLVLAVEGFIDEGIVVGLIRGDTLPGLLQGRQRAGDIVRLDAHGDLGRW